MIPKVLHQVWVGGPVPEHLAGYRQAWLDLHPDWEHHLWTEANLPPLVNQRLFDEADRYAPGSEGQFRSDVARYELLAVHGGVYMDLDMEPIRPIDALLDTASCWACYEDPGARWVNNAAMGCTPGHGFLARLVERLARNVEERAGPGKRPNVLTGPQYVTAVWRADWRKKVTVLPHRAFYPYLWSQVGTAAERGPWGPDTWAVHHWQNTRTNGRAARHRRAQVGSRHARR